MKYMKLGCRPDTFYTTEAVRSVSSEILSDLVIQVKSSRYLLHKFPMLSKCLRLQSLMSSECPETSQQQVIKLQDFPGEAEAFELCAKFCYGITITLSAYNIVAVRCAAEYLEMTEEAEDGNLIQKLEHFLTSSVLNGWKDSIVTLQTTNALPLWSEDLEITSRCIEAISSKVSANPSKISSSGSYSRKGRDEIYCNGGNKIDNSQWWGEDMADLGIDLYWRTMTAIKSSGRNIPSSLIGDALRIYASKWLPNIRECTESVRKRQTSSDRDSDSIPGCSKNRLALESILSLLPVEKGAVSCSFLLQLLKISSVLKASSSSRTELAKKAAIQLDEAAVNDLLIPSSDKSGTLYDVDVVMMMVKEFQSQTTRTVGPSRSRIRIERGRPRSEENINVDMQQNRGSSSSSLASHGSKVKVAKLVDVYLQEIARDEKLPLQKFIELAEMIPEISRVNHDDLYKAIDIYLKAHLKIEKDERKRLCRILDCKRLSPETSKQAAQNELLPLRVIVQLLFFEHARAAMAGANVSTDLPGNITTLLVNPPRETLGLTRSTTTTTRRPSTLRSKLQEEDELVAQNGLNTDEHFQSAASRFKAFCAIPRQPKKIFSKLLAINRSLSQRN